MVKAITVGASLLFLASLLLATLLLANCTVDLPASAPVPKPAHPAVEAQRERAGPADRATIHGRLMALSEAGALPRRLSAESADRIVHGLTRLAEAKAALRIRRGSKEAVEGENRALEQLCIELSGISCEKLLFTPHAGFRQ